MEKMAPSIMAVFSISFRVGSGGVVLPCYFSTFLQKFQGKIHPFKEV